MTYQEKCTRRDFFTKSLAGGTTFAALCAGFPNLARAAVAPSERITLALIGCGGMGGAHLSALLPYQGVQFIAACDVDQTRLEAARQRIEQAYAEQASSSSYSGCDTYTDFRELLQRDDLDAVVIATPDHWHVLVSREAARWGKDIYCEKPLGHNIAEQRELVQTVRRYGRVFQTGSQQRSDSTFRFACELVRNGRIGKLHTVEVGLYRSPEIGPQAPMSVPEGFDYDMWLGPAPDAPYTAARCHGNFRWLLDYSAGMISDWGAHHIDIAQWGMGTELTGPESVEGWGQFPTEGLYDVATIFEVHAQYGNGVKMVISSEIDNGIKFIGDDGWVFVTRGRIDANPKSLLRETFGPNEIHLYQTPGHHANFFECMRTRKEPIASVEIAHRSMSVGHLGNIAMQLGRKVYWDAEKEQCINDSTANRMLSRHRRSPWHM